MNYIIINGAPGVGKTTLIDQLQSQLKGRYALIDGDDLARNVTIEDRTEWLNLMQDNIAACSENFKKHGSKHIIISFVFPTQERLNRLKNLLVSQADRFKHIILSCEKKELKTRLHIREKQRVISIEQALLFNRKINDLNNDYYVDTTSKDPSLVLSEVLKILKKECQ